MKTKNNLEGKDKIRLIVIGIVSLFVIVTGTLFAIKSFKNDNIMGGILGIVIAIIILMFAVIVFKRGNRDLKKGFPLKDERSKKVIEKASSMAFYVTLYMLLAIGFLSEDVIKFRDISQATSLGVAGMALLFMIFWAYYNKQTL